MEFTIISASTRRNSQSLKVSSFLEKLLAENELCQNVNILDLSTINLPLWDEEYWTLGESWNQTWSTVAEILKKSDAIILVVPEWGGMVPPALKNLFLLCSNGEVTHTPALLVSISSGINGGSYPIAELRMSSYKNTKLCYIPENIIIKKVTEVLNISQKELNLEDTNIQKRILHILKILSVYGKAFRTIKSDEIMFEDKYPFGM